MSTYCCDLKKLCKALAIWVIPICLVWNLRWRILGKSDSIRKSCKHLSNRIPIVLLIRYSVKSNLTITSAELLNSELQLYKDAGGCSLVDCTPSVSHYKPELLPELSSMSNVNIISGCGYYVDQFMPADVKLMSKEEMASNIIEEVTQGIRGTNIRCGVIGEIGCSAPLTDAEIRSLQAAAIAQRTTGKP